jgi:hypothetical protein
MQKPVKDFGICSTSKVRPFLKSPTALSVYTVAVGFVPTSMHDDVSPGLRFDGGERDVPDCFSSSFSEVFTAFTRDL